MVKDNLKKSALSAFTRKGDYVAILSTDGSAKIWNTSNGCLVAEWKPSDADHDISYSCIACSFTGKKLMGSILAVDMRGVCGLSFANKGRLLHVVGHKGTASEINIETGEVLKEFKISKKSISSLAFSYYEKYLAIVGCKLRVKIWENGEGVLKFPDDLGNVQYVSISSDAKAVVTSDFEGRHLQVWWFSGSGTAYIWNLSASSEEETQPTKIIADKENSESSKKKLGSIIAFRLQPFGEDKQMKALVTYGSVDHPQFSVSSISNSRGENIVSILGDETNPVQQHDHPSEKVGGCLSYITNQLLKFHLEYVPKYGGMESKIRVTGDIWMDSDAWPGSWRMNRTVGIALLLCWTRLGGYLLKALRRSSQYK
ncbi:hypothetical protein OROGR_000777 [Orobanche gracilis]